MKTVLVSGSDTGIGKTWVVGSLARQLCAQGFSVQIVKPVETGVSDSDESDADRAKGRCESTQVESFVLRKYRAPLAPTTAAELQGAVFKFEELVSEVQALSEVDYRLVEGAGSLAVPLALDGRDWTDFAHAIGAEKTVLVVADRLGAIGQARMAYHFANSKRLHSGIVLNRLEETTDDATLKSNRDLLNELNLPLWGCHEFGDTSLELAEGFWA